MLLVAHCAIHDDGGSMIGVCKRYMRLAMALAERGHEVILVSVSSSDYGDELTERVHDRIAILNLPSFDAGDGQIGLDETGEPGRASSSGSSLSSPTSSC